MRMGHEISCVRLTPQEPRVLEPHENTSPSWVANKLWKLPAATHTTEWSPAICVGDARPAAATAGPDARASPLPQLRAAPFVQHASTCSFPVASWQIMNDDGS